LHINGIFEFPHFAVNKAMATKDKSEFGGAKSCPIL